MSNDTNFIPEITINNTGVTKEVEIDGVKQEVEVPAQEGFNLKTKDLEGNYKKQFFLKDLQGIVILDRYKIQSKYGEDPAYFSNEFEFTGKRNYVRVYCPSNKEVLYEGPYKGAKEHFATGGLNKMGLPLKTFDVYSVLYLLIEGEVFRFNWKMNRGNGWFSYKDGCKIDKESRDDTKDYRGAITKFGLERKKFGKIEFWTCNLQNIGANDRAEADSVGNTLEATMDEKEGQRGENKTLQDAPGFGGTPQEPKENPEEEIAVDSIPF